MQEQGLLWKTLLTLILNPQLEAKLIAALNADNYFRKQDKEFAALIKEYKELIIDFLEYFTCS